MLKKNNINNKVNIETIYLIQSLEGDKLKAYKDNVGIPTIGTGLTFYPTDIKIKNRSVYENEKVKLNDELISADQSEYLLALAIDQFCEDIDNLLTRPARNPFIYGSLISFVYNIGLNAFKSSTLLTKWNLGEDDQLNIIEQELPKWNKAGGKILKGLVNRRIKEIKFSKLSPITSYSKDKINNL